MLLFLPNARCNSDRTTVNLSRLQAAYPSDIAKLTPKPKLFVDVSKMTATPPTKTQPFDPYKNHTNYGDLVGKLRNPIAADPINKWMTTGRVVGRPMGQSPKRSQQPKFQPQEPEVTAKAYKDFFQQDMRGSLSGSMSGCIYSRLDQTRDEKAQDLELSTKAKKQVEFEEPPQAKKTIPYQKPFGARYPYPAGIYTKDRSNEEYSALFASLNNP